ncbi:hypothetical protein BC833DRAFT_611247 [Globomyces pollinis-pini]|nr:hypothetical protein BC833DRAFT_611247 [Globomyces pollinis-pini]
MMRPNKIVYCLFLASMLNIPHNLFSFIAVYLSAIHPEISTTGIWLAQALCAAGVRCIEFYVNYQIIVGLAEDKMASILFILNWICGSVVIFGRIFDIFANNILGASEVRWGMAIVSFSGVINSTFGIFCLRTGLMSLMSEEARSTTKIGAVMSNCVFRIFFIQFIDIGLIIGYLWAKKSYYTNWWFWIFDNLDNSRALLLLMDVICVRMFSAPKEQHGTKSLNTNLTDLKSVKRVEVEVK